MWSIKLVTFYIGRVGGLTNDTNNTVWHPNLCLPQNKQVLTVTTHSYIQTDVFRKTKTGVQGNYPFLHPN